MFVPGQNRSARPEFVAALSKNLESVGFTFSADVIERLQTWTPDELLGLAESLLPHLLKMVGGDVRYLPMYPNFPAQVMEASEAELYLNALLHYYGDVIGEGILPHYNKRPRNALVIAENLKVLQLADENTIQSVCRGLIASNTSLSKSDQSDLRGLLEACRDHIEEVLPESIPFKEIQSVVCKFLLERVENPAPLLGRFLKTATDVLRLATEISGGDTSLAASTRFVSFSRNHRRVLLGLLDKVTRPDEDLHRHRGKWIRLAERLHPGEYGKQFPLALAAIQRLRRNEKPVTFNSKVEQLLREGDTAKTAVLLCQRPGELARRLDHLLREGPDKADRVLDCFAKVAGDVSTPVLLQLIAHFKQRAYDQSPRRLKDTPEKQSLPFFEKAVRSLMKPASAHKHTPMLQPMRTVFPKGQISRLMRVPLAKSWLAPAMAERVVELAKAALVERFSALPSLGKCFVSEDLQNFTVPFSRRSASKSLRTVARGSRLPLPDANVVRFFLWWKEGKVNSQDTGRVDLDLSATIFDASWRYLNHISYTNLKATKLGCCHSGDITSAPNGASEFIDIDLDKLRKAGARYVVCSVMSFTRHPYCDLPECYVGWMSRDKPQSGEVFEPATVRDRIDLAANHRISIPMLIDLKGRAAIWADLALKSMPCHNVNIEGNMRGMQHYGAGIESMTKPNLFDLFSLHVQARGEACDRIEEADSLFAVDEGITPFDFETIASGYLA